MWRGYAGLSDMRYTHLSVNHLAKFKNPETGACTNSAEGLNSGLKWHIEAHYRMIDGIDMHLGKYIWCRQSIDRLFDAFIDALKDVHYDIE
jgi:hypothetical protein